MPLVTFPRALARINRVVTNPIQGRWAWRLAPWAVVVHIGRRSGKTFRTPVLAWDLPGDRIAIGLSYGESAHWVRNLIGADGGHLVRRGTVFRLSFPQIIDPADVPDFTGPGRAFARSVGGRALIATLSEPGPDAPPVRGPLRPD